jgi:hypothetical protein
MQSGNKYPVRANNETKNSLPGKVLVLQSVAERILRHARRPRGLGEAVADGREDRVPVFLCVLYWVWGIGGGDG